MNTNICFSEKTITIIPASSLVRQYVDSLDWAQPEAIWKIYDNVSEETPDGLYGALMDDLADSDNITFGGASHTLVPLVMFNNEYSMEIVPTSGTGLVLNPYNVYVDMEN